MYFLQLQNFLYIVYDELRFYGARRIFQGLLANYKPYFTRSWCSPQWVQHSSSPFLQKIYSCSLIRVNVL